MFYLVTRISTITFSIYNLKRAVKLRLNQNLIFKTLRRCAYKDCIRIADSLGNPY